MQDSTKKAPARKQPVPEPLRRHIAARKQLTLQDRLRRLAWPFVREQPTPHEADILAVLTALALGDEEVAHKLAEVARKHQRGLVREDSKGARDYWLEELAAWDGSNAEEVAHRFVSVMAEFLPVFGNNGTAQFVPPERVAAVREAFVNVHRVKDVDTSNYAKNPGRALMSAGLRAMGLSDSEVEGLLDYLRKGEDRPEA